MINANLSGAGRVLVGCAVGPRSGSRLEIIHSRRGSWTASCCESASDIPTAERSSSCSRGGWSAARTRSSWRRSSTATYTIPDGERAIAAPIYGSALLLTAELAYWSLDKRVRQRVRAGAVTPRLLAILAVSAAAIPASALVVVAAEADLSRSPATTAAGAAAIIACVALLAAVARLRGKAQSSSPSSMSSATSSLNGRSFS